jgi:hypothetical protein
MQAQFARLAQRTTTALVAPGPRSTVHVSLQLPKGAKLRALPKPHKAKLGGATFELESADKADQVELTRRVQVPLIRVAPSEYPAFAEFCRNVDRAEASELSIVLPE